MLANFRYCWKAHYRMCLKPAFSLRPAWEIPLDLKSPIVYKLMRNDPTFHLIYHLSKSFPREVMPSIASFTSSSMQHTPFSPL